MAVEKMGLNFTDLKNLTFPEFNSTKRASDYLREIPQVANESTNYWFGWGVIFSLFAVLYYLLREDEQRGGFGYDEGQSFAITSSITFIFGLLFVMVGFIHNFMPVGVMGGLFLVIQLIITYINNDR